MSLLSPKVSLRDYFAAHAPKVPNWFEAGTALPETGPAMSRLRDAMRTVPELAELESPEFDHVANAVYNVTRGRTDLEEHIRMARSAFNRAEAVVRDERAEDQAARTFRWCWHYADQMLLFRNNK